MFRRGSCSPQRKRMGRVLVGRTSCLLPDEAVRLVAAYNAHCVRTGEAPLDDVDGSGSGSGPNLATSLAEMHRRLGTEPGAEASWTDMPFVSRDRSLRTHLRSRVFRPEMPSSWAMNSREWLSNRDIHMVMRQYEDRCPDFTFLGVFPIDFAEVLEDGKCVSIEMCRVDVGNLWARGKRHVGVVFNTDKHYQSGSHWVCCYVGLDPSPKARFFGMFYYDSVCQPPPAEILGLWQELRQQVSKLHGRGVASRFAWRVNPARRQFKDTECGVFAMFFIVCCLAGRFDLDAICNMMGLDDDVHRLRSVFFRENRAAALRGASASIPPGTI